MLTDSIVANPSLIGAAFCYSDADGFFWVGCADNWVRFRASASDLKAVFALLDGSRSLERFLEEAHAIAPRLSKDQLSRMLHTLAHKGLLMAGNPALPPVLESDPAYLERHTRDLEFYALFETINTSRYSYLAHVRSARVVVIGLGGLGSWLALSLACIGIGGLVGADFDCVELSNLARQILYTPADLGQTKVGAAEAFFARFSPEMQFQPYSVRINGPDDVTPLLQNADFVVLAADWPPGRIGRWVNQACVEGAVPAIYMGANTAAIRIGPLVLPGQSSCFECAAIQRRRLTAEFTSLEVALEITSQREGWFVNAPAISPIPALIGHMLSWEVLCALTSIQQPSTVEHLILFDLLTFKGRRMPLVKQATCPVCATFKKQQQTHLGRT